MIGSSVGRRGLPVLVEVELVDAAIEAVAGASRRHASGSWSLGRREEWRFGVLFKV